MIDGHSILSRRGPQNLIKLLSVPLGSCVFILRTQFSLFINLICLAYLDRLASFLFLK